VIKDPATAVPATVTNALLDDVAASFKFNRFIEHPWIYFTGHPLDRIQFLR
jgi:hypothetical protein